MRHYVLEYFRDVWNVWLKAKTTKDCQVAVDDLIPGSRSAKRATVLHCQFPNMEGVRLRDRPSQIGGAAVDFGIFYMRKRMFLTFPTRGPIQNYMAIPTQSLNEKALNKIL